MHQAGLKSKAGHRDQILAIVSILLRYGADLSMTSKIPRDGTALQSLAQGLTNEDTTQLMQLLLKARMMLAAKTGDINLLRKLIEVEGANVNLRDHVSPLLYFCFLVSWFHA